jgi:hypothetical protein
MLNISTLGGRNRERLTVEGNRLALSTLMLLILSIPAFGQVPSRQLELPCAPSATVSSSCTGQLSSIESGRETLIEQADYFVPMTNRERWVHYAYSVVQPQAILFPAFQAGLNQDRNTPHEWGQGAEGYGRRFASVYGEHLIGSTVGNAIAFGLHEDNRYFKSRKTEIGRRLSYAITSVLLARHDDGSRFISYSAIGGGAAGAFISRTWQPQSTHSAGDAAVSFGYAIAERAGINVAREFSPRRLERILK